MLSEAIGVAAHVGASHAVVADQELRAWSLRAADVSAVRTSTTLDTVAWPIEALMMPAAVSYCLASLAAGTGIDLTGWVIAR